jgi:hypothetical protein
VTVDGVLDWQLRLLYSSANYNWLSQFYNHQLCRLHSRYIHLSAATWPSLYSLGPDPIGSTALALLSGRYQVTPSEQTAGGTIAPLLTHQSHSMHIIIPTIGLLIHHVPAYITWNLSHWLVEANFWQLPYQVQRYCECRGWVGKKYIDILWRKLSKCWRQREETVQFIMPTKYGLFENAV